MRSFSKAYGLAGARIGYMASQKSNIETISKTKSGYEANMLSVNALHFVLDNISITKNYVKNAKIGMQFLKKNLQKLEIKYYGGSDSNFIFIDFESIKKAKTIYKKLKSKNIDIKVLNNLNLKKIDNIRFPVIKILNNLSDEDSLFETIIVSANDKLVKLFLNNKIKFTDISNTCLLYTSPSPRDS